MRMGRVTAGTRRVIGVTDTGMLVRQTQARGSSGRTTSAPAARGRAPPDGGGAAAKTMSAATRLSAPGGARRWFGACPGPSTTAAMPLQNRCCLLPWAPAAPPIDISGERRCRGTGRRGLVHLEPSAGLHCPTQAPAPTRHIEVAGHNSQAPRPRRSRDALASQSSHRSLRLRGRFFRSRSPVSLSRVTEAE
jgi:hypothetical protein